jgi:hypothetical protein
MGRRILPKRPIRITEEEFKAHEEEIISKIREGRLAVTCPDLSFIDSRPDGRLFVTYLDKKTSEEPADGFAFKGWPYKGAVMNKPQSAPGSTNSPGFHTPTDEIGFQGQSGTDAGWDGGASGEAGDPGVVEGPGVVGPEGTQEAAVSKPVFPSEDVTTELVDPNKFLLETQVPPVQDGQTITVDMPKKKNKRSKE